MKSPYSLRQMVEEDVSQVNEIDREAFPTQWPPTNYKQELKNQLAHYLVASDDSRTVEHVTSAEAGLSRFASGVRRWLGRGTAGTPTVTTTTPYIVGFVGVWVIADESHVTNIAVREAYRRRGIGELLLLSVIDLSRELKASVVTLEVRASNAPAQTLYAKYGFKQVGLRRGYYVDNREDGILMSTDNITSPLYQARLERLREALAARWATPVRDQKS